MPFVDLEPGQLADDALPPDFLRLWEQLARCGHQAEPFCAAPIWNLSYHEVFTPGRRLYYAMDGGSIVLFTQLRFDNELTAYLPIDDSWLFGRPLLGEASPLLLADCMEELLQGGGASRPGEVRLFISGLRHGSLFASALFQRFSGDFVMYRAESWIQASASLQGGYDGWLSRRSANTRAKLRKAQRAAARDGIEFERLRPGPDQAKDVYERMLGVEEKSWKGIGKCGMAESPCREFYGVMLARLARVGRGLVTFAVKNGQDIGFIFGGLEGKVYRGQQFSYSAEAARYSVGNLLQADCVQWLCDLGMSRYDMGSINGDRMGYKKHWTEQFLLVQTWRLDKLNSQ